MLSKISVLAGQDKTGHPEPVQRVDITAGEVLAVVGPTGSGKTQLISDIEQYAEGETPTGRSILLNDTPVGDNDPDDVPRHLVAEVSQKMNFVMDSSVAAFLSRHARVRAIEDTDKVIADVLAVTNTLSGEPVSPSENLTLLSGGQTRALMVADVALISNAPVVLIDEIENAGIDRLQALKILTGQGKIVLVVTHDLTLALMAGRRVVMKNGGMYRVHQTTPAEKALMEQLVAIETDISRLRNGVRNGDCIREPLNKKEEKPLWQGFCYTVR